jgi:hypothetical protein
VIGEHATAVLALLNADPNLRVFDGAPPDLTAPPYVVAWVSLDSEGTDRLTVVTDRPALRVTTHSVATTGAGARIISGRVRAALLDVTLAVTGWRTWPIRHELGLPPQLDESTGKPWISVIDGWTFTTTPA